ncbi:MAG: ATP-grasp domain-containing protein [bacterium]
MPFREPRLGIVYEHPHWFAPLFAELDRRGLPYDRIDVSRHRFDPVAGGAPWTVALNRMSPSAYLRGHGHTIPYTRELLRFLEGQNVDVINGTRAFALETSKVGQLTLLHSLGLRAPRARVINHASQAALAAEGLTFPVVVKPNIGGSGAGVQRFETAEEVQAAASLGTIDIGIDGTALVQEFLPARDGHVVRVEVLGGRFLYAIKVYPNPDAGFNLCPADICQPDGVTASAPTVVPLAISAPGLSSDPVVANLQKVALRVEGTTPPHDVVEDVLGIIAAGGLDIGGVEYLVNDRDGQVYYYDINALSNFVTDAPNIVGFDPYAILADYLETRGQLPRRTVLGVTAAL